VSTGNGEREDSPPGGTSSTGLAILDPQEGGLPLSLFFLCGSASPR
jgi:hypothetical protein